MLICADALEKLDFSALMEVYAEGNRENAEDLYPEETPARRMELAERDFRDYLIDGFYGTAHGTYWIWAEEGRYVSALRLEEHEDGLLLEALETRPEYRKSGRAKKLVMAVLERLPRGTRVYSHVGRKNIPSLAVHHACGFTKALDYAVQPDGEVYDHQVTMAVTV